MAVPLYSPNSCSTLPSFGLTMNRPAVRNVTNAIASAAKTISGADSARMFMTSIQIERRVGEEQDEEHGQAGHSVVGAFANHGLGSSLKDDIIVISN